MSANAYQRAHAYENSGNHNINNPFFLQNEQRATARDVVAEKMNTYQSIFGPMQEVEPDYNLLSDRSFNNRSFAMRYQVDHIATGLLYDTRAINYDLDLMFPTMPTVQSDKIRWTTTIAEPEVLLPTAWGNTGHKAEFNYDENSKQLIRRTRAMEFDDSELTRPGSDEFDMKLQQLAIEIATTKQWDECAAIVYATRRWKLKDYGMDAGMAFSSILSHEVDMFGILSKRTDGWETLNAHMDELIGFTAQGGRGGAIVVIPRTLSFALQVTDSKRKDYHYAGERGPLRRELGLDSLSMVDNLGNIIVDVYQQTLRTGGPEQLFHNYDVITPKWMLATRKHQKNGYNWRTEEQGMRMYDHTRRGIKELSLREMYDNNNLYNHEGKIAFPEFEAERPADRYPEMYENNCFYDKVYGQHGKYETVRYVGQMGRSYQTVRKEAQSLCEALEPDQQYARNLLRKATGIVKLNGKQNLAAMQTLITANRTALNNAKITPRALTYTRNGKTYRHAPTLDAQVDSVTGFFSTGANTGGTAGGLSLAALRAMAGGRGVGIAATIREIIDFCESVAETMSRIGHSVFADGNTVIGNLTAADDAEAVFQALIGEHLPVFGLATTAPTVGDLKPNDAAVLTDIQKVQRTGILLAVVQKALAVLAEQGVAIDSDTLNENGFTFAKIFNAGAASAPDAVFAYAVAIMRLIKVIPWTKQDANGDIVSDDAKFRQFVAAASEATAGDYIKNVSSIDEVKQLVTKLAEDYNVPAKIQQTLQKSVVKFDEGINKTEKDQAEKLSGMAATETAALFKVLLDNLEAQSATVVAGGTDKAGHFVRTPLFASKENIMEALREDINTLNGYDFRFADPDDISRFMTWEEFKVRYGRIERAGMDHWTLRGNIASENIEDHHLALGNSWVKNFIQNSANEGQEFNIDEQLNDNDDESSFFHDDINESWNSSSSSSSFVSANIGANVPDMVKDMHAKRREMRTRFTAENGGDIAPSHPELLTKRFSQAYREARTKNGNEFERLCAVLLLGVELSKDMQDGFLDHDVMLPYTNLVERLFERYHTMAVSKGNQGIGAFVTNGTERFFMQLDAKRGKWHSLFSMMSTAVIIRDQELAYIQNAGLSGNGGGIGFEWYDLHADFDSQYQGQLASLICIPVSSEVTHADFGEGPPLGYQYEEENRNSAYTYKTPPEYFSSIAKWTDMINNAEPAVDMQEENTFVRGTRVVLQGHHEIRDPTAVNHSWCVYPDRVLPQISNNAYNTIEGLPYMFGEVDYSQRMAA